MKASNDTRPATEQYADTGSCHMSMNGGCQINANGEHNMSAGGSRSTNIDDWRSTSVSNSHGTSSNGNLGMKQNERDRSNRRDRRDRRDRASKSDRRDSYRRANRSGGSFYDTVSDILPFRLTFVSAAVMIGIVFVVFATTCLAAITLSSASEKLDTAKADVRSCADYYAAESTAVDILTTLASDDGNSLADKNGELKYRPDGDKNTVITISRNGGSFSFDVPVGRTSGKGQNSASSATNIFSGTGESGTQKNLHVIAQITEGNITVIEWYLRDAD